MSRIKSRYGDRDRYDAFPPLEFRFDLSIPAPRKEMNHCGQGSAGEGGGLRGRFILDQTNIGGYNVVTMITNLISIGNSRGIRIPKPLINESGLGDKIELLVKKGEIRIVSAPTKVTSVSSTVLLSERALAFDWNRKEEDEAWASLQ